MSIDQPEQNAIGPYRHIIWDWNGTLLDDVAVTAKVVSTLLQKRGLEPLTLHDYRRLCDFPAIDFYRRLGMDLQKYPFDQLARDYMALYEPMLKNCRLQKNALAFLEETTTRGITHSILSAYQQHRLIRAVSHFGLTDYFTQTVGLADDYAHSKIDLGLDWVKSLPYPPEEILFVGDTRHDHETAQAMGVQCVLLTCGHQNRRRLEETCPQAPLFDCVQPLQEWLFS